MQRQRQENSGLQQKEKERVDGVKEEMKMERKGIEQGKWGKKKERIAYTGIKMLFFLRSSGRQREEGKENSGVVDFSNTGSDGGKERKRKERSRANAMLCSSTCDGETEEVEVCEMN